MISPKKKGYTGLLHLVVQIVALTGTLSDTSEDRVTTMCLGNVVDQLLNKHSLADTSASEETNLSSASVRSQQIDDCVQVSKGEKRKKGCLIVMVTLDASDQNLGGGGLVNKLGCVGVNGGHLGTFDGAALVDGIASNVHDATECARTDGNHDGVASIKALDSTRKTLGTCTEMVSITIVIANKGTCRPLQYIEQYSLPNVERPPIPVSGRSCRS